MGRREMTGTFDLTRESVDQKSVRVLAPAGRVDTSTASEFKARLMDALSSDQPLILDLSDVSDMDSVAIGVLMAVRKQARMTRGHFVVACPPGELRRMFDLTRMDLAFDIVDSRDEAVVHLGMLA